MLWSKGKALSIAWDAALDVQPIAHPNTDCNTAAPKVGSEK
jgi:hypothetical protein